MKVNFKLKYAFVSNFFIQTPATDSTQQVEVALPLQPFSPVASTLLPRMMYQSEENGVQIALTDTEVVSSYPSRQKRMHSVEGNEQNKKKDTKASPDSVDKLEKGATNVAVVQPMNSNSTIPQTLSISQSDNISLTIPSVISQSVESSCPKKTPRPANKSKNAASHCESTVKSNDQTKEISTGNHSSLKVVEASVPQPKVAKFKVAEQVVEPQIVEPKVVKSKVVQPKVADPKIVQPKKSTTAANASKTTLKSTTSKVFPKRPEAAIKLPAAVTELNQAKAATATCFPSSAKEPTKTGTAASTNISTDAVLLKPHRTAVRCVNIYGRCAFTASEDGALHIYDLKTDSLLKIITGQTHPVNWLFGVSLSTSDAVLKTIKSTSVYLRHLTLITGSTDKHIRQITLDSCSVIQKRISNCTLTCAIGTRNVTKLLVGTKEGSVISYNPTYNTMWTTNIKSKLNYLKNS